MPRTTTISRVSDPTPEVLDFTFDSLGVNNVTNEFNAVPQDCDVLDNIINTKPHKAEQRPGIIPKVDLSSLTEKYATFSGVNSEVYASRTITDLVPITANFQDFSIPKSNDPNSTDWFVYKTVRIWVIQCDRSTAGNKRNLEFWAVAQDIESGAFDNPVQMTVDMMDTGTGKSLRVLGGYGSNAIPSGAALLSGFPIRGFSQSRTTVVANVAECEISGEANDDGSPYIVIAAGDYPDSRSLLFQFIDRVNPHGAFNSDSTYGNERYWYFSPEQYATRENTLTGVSNFCRVDEHGEDINGAPVINLPNGTYTFGLFGVERSGEHFGVLGTEFIKELNNTGNGYVKSALNYVIKIDPSTFDTMRQRNIDQYMIGIKWSAGKFTPIIPEEYRTDGYRWQHADAEYRKKIDRDRVAMIQEQLATYEKLSATAWDDYYALFGGTISINAQEFDSGHTSTNNGYITGATFDPHRFNMWQGMVYTETVGGINYITPVHGTVKADPGVFVNQGVFQDCQAVFLMADTNNAVRIPFTGGVRYVDTTDPQSWRIDCGAITLPTISANSPVMCQIGSGWMSAGGGTYEASFQLWNLAQQVDFSRKFDDMRKRNPAPRYKHRAFLQQTAFVCSTCNEQPSEPLWDSNNQSTSDQVSHPQKLDQRIWHTTPDPVTGVLRRHYFLSYYQSRVAVKNIKPVHIQNMQDYFSVYSNALVALGTNGVEILDYTVDPVTGLRDLKTRNFHDNISVVNQYGTEVFNNNVYSLDKYGQVWVFDGHSDPVCISYPIEKDIAAMGYSTDELRYGSIRRCYIDNKPFLVYAVLKGLTYAAPAPTPASKVNYASNIGIAMPSTTSRSALSDYFWILNLESAQKRALSGWTRCYARSYKTSAFSSQLIPNMTSNVLPLNYVASATYHGGSFTDNQDYYLMFDGNNVSGWTLTQTGADSPFFIKAQIDLGSGNAQQVNRYTFRARLRDSTNAAVQITWKFEGSNDGSSWDTLDTQTNVNPFTIQTVTFNNATSYRYYRINIQSMNSANAFQDLSIYVIGLYAYDQTAVPQHLAWNWSPAYANKRLYFFNEQELVAFDETQLYDAVEFTNPTHYTIYGEVDPNYLRPADPRKLNLFKQAKWAIIYGDYAANSLYINLFNEAGESTGVYPAVLRADGAEATIRFAPLFGNRALKIKITAQINGTALVLRNCSILTNMIGRRTGI